LARHPVAAPEAVAVLARPTAHRSLARHSGVAADATQALAFANAPADLVGKGRCVEAIVHFVSFFSFVVRANRVIDAGGDAMTRQTAMRSSMAPRARVTAAGSSRRSRSSRPRAISPLRSASQTSIT